MTAFRLFDPFQTFFDQSGNLAVGGTLKFYESGTTTEQDVYADQALTVNSGSSVSIGTDGRPVTDIWGQGSYRARLYDVDGALVSDRDNLSIPGAGALTIPALETGSFLTNDGATLQWQHIISQLLPDPTGQSGKILGTDGAVGLWQSISSLGITKITTDVGASSFTAQIGTLLIQGGTGSCNASGDHTASTTVTFGTAFGTKPLVFPMPTTSSAGSAGYFVIPAPYGIGTTSFTLGWNTNSSDGADGNITGEITFNWIAFGSVAS